MARMQRANFLYQIPDHVGMTTFGVGDDVN